MPPLPPEKETLEALKFVLLPAAGGAAVVAAVVLSLGRWAAPLASAAGVVAGFAHAVWMKPDIIPWAPDPTRPWQFLPRAALVLVIVGLVTHTAAALLTRYRPDARLRLFDLGLWVLKGAAVAAVAWRLVPEPLRADVPWVTGAFAAAVLALWVVLDHFARNETHGLTVGLLAAVMLGAGGLMIYSHTGRFLEIATALAAALVGVAAVSAAGRVGASGAVPAVAVGLPGLLLNGRFVNPSAIPVAAFGLVALAPLALTPFLIPAVARRNPWALAAAKVVLVMAPVVAALVMAGQVEKLVWEPEW